MSKQQTTVDFPKKPTEPQKRTSGESPRKIFGDYHTHTDNSDGHDTVENMVRTAASLGLKEIAITDHGPGKMFGKIKAKNFSMLRALVEKSGTENNIKAFFGVEANITGTRGQIDIKHEDLCGGNETNAKANANTEVQGQSNGCVEILLCGIHRFVKPVNLRSLFGFFIPNWFWGLLHWTPEGRRRKNTEVVKRAILSNQIDIWTHPNRYFRVDVVEIAKVCAERGTLVELNGKSISFRPIDFERMAAVGAKFVVGSDAHRAGRIAEVTRVWDFLKLCDWKEEDIINVNGTFRRGAPIQIPPLEASKELPDIKEKNKKQKQQSK